MTVRDIHHVQVTTPLDRLDEMNAFYRDVLGLTPTDRPTGDGWRSDGVWFTVGGRQLHIGVEENVDRTGTRSHVAYQVDNLQEMLVRLRAAGCVCQTDDDAGIPMIPGWRRLQTRDPVGNQIEFVSPAPDKPPVSPERA
jgi:catechol 2,3-dioxygenase-like lactoylglutathione lyase family enzyme